MIWYFVPAPFRMFKFAVVVSVLVVFAAVVAVSGCVNRGQFLRDMEESFRHKFAKKPQVVEGNLRCLKVSMGAVKG